MESLVRLLAGCERVESISIAPMIGSDIDFNYPCDFEHFAACLKAMRGNVADVIIVCGDPPENCYIMEYAGADCRHIVLGTACAADAPPWQGIFAAIRTILATP